MIKILQSGAYLILIHWSNNHLYAPGMVLADKQAFITIHKLMIIILTVSVDMFVSSGYIFGSAGSLNWMLPYDNYTSSDSLLFYIIQMTYINSTWRESHVARSNVEVVDCLHGCSFRWALNKYQCFHSVWPCLHDRYCFHTKCMLLIFCVYIYLRNILCWQKCSYPWILDQPDDRMEWKEDGVAQVLNGKVTVAWRFLCFSGFLENNCVHNAHNNFALFM